VAFHPDLTDEQRSNLRTLAAYLRTLPTDYPDFAMSDFTNDAAGNGHPRIVGCGTAACAVGHGPAAGIAPLEYEKTWVEYSYRTLCDDADGWDWCFSGCWSDVDNSAHGAAARIEHMLDHGVPTDGHRQEMGLAPLSYTVEAA